MITYRQVPVGETLQGLLYLNSIDIRGDRDRPVIGLVAGLHGDETASVLGLLSFIRSVRKKMACDAQGRVVHPLHGRIVAFPAVNVIGLTRGEHGVLRAGDNAEEENMNRDFPGSQEGTLCDITAETLFRTLVELKPDVVVDLHTMHTRSFPCTFLDRTSDETLQKRIVEYARAFGFVIAYDLVPGVYEKDGLDTSLSGKLVEQGIPAFTAEVPGGQFAGGHSIDAVVAGIRRLADALGLMQDENPSAHMYPYPIVPGRIYQRTQGIPIKRAGFFHPTVKPFAWVSKGDVIGAVLNWRADVVERLVSPVAGIVFDIADTSTVATGDILFEFLVDPDGGVDTERIS